MQTKFSKKKTGSISPLPTAKVQRCISQKISKNQNKQIFLKTYDLHLCALLFLQCKSPQMQTATLDVTSFCYLCKQGNKVVDLIKNNSPSMTYYLAHIRTDCQTFISKCKPARFDDPQFGKQIIKERNEKCPCLKTKCAAFLLSKSEPSNRAL